MIRLLASLALLVALAACAHAPAGDAVDLTAAPAVGGTLIVVGTLATNDCEARTAALYTAAIVAVQRTAVAVRAGTVAPASARTVLELGRSARADLDATCAGGAFDAARFASATASVARMQTIIGGTP